MTNWSTRAASPGPIGSGTPSTGAFTTLSASGAVSFTSTLAIAGALTFNDAGADVDARFEGDTDANLLMLDAGNDRVGIGTGSPASKLHVRSGDVRLTQYAAQAAFISERYNGSIGSEANLSAAQNAAQWGVRGYGATAISGSRATISAVTTENWTDAAHGIEWRFGVTANTTTMLADALRIQQDRSLRLHNVTAEPSSSPADAVTLYAVDIAASSELRVRDEAGNQTTLSPHNPQMVDATGRVTDYVHKESNPFTGDEIELDIVGALLEVERMTGKRLIHVRELPPERREDWDANQAANEAEAAREQRAYTRKAIPARVAARLAQKRGKTP